MKNFIRTFIVIISVLIISLNWNCSDNDINHVSKKTIKVGYTGIKLMVHPSTNTYIPCTDIIEGAYVIIQDSEGIVAQGYTDETGEFGVGSLFSGTYDLYAEYGTVYGSVRNWNHEEIETVCILMTSDK